MECAGSVSRKEGSPWPQDTAGFSRHSPQGISGREEGGLQSVRLRWGAPLTSPNHDVWPELVQ